MNRSFVKPFLVTAAALSVMGCTFTWGEKEPEFQPYAQNVKSYTQTIELNGLQGGARVQIDYTTYNERVLYKEKRSYGSIAVEKMLVRSYQGEEFKKGILLESYDDKESIKAFDQEPGNLITTSKKSVISINADFAKVKRFVQLRHAVEVSRCQSSKYWSFVSSFSPDVRGNFLMQISQVLTAKYSEREVLLAVTPSGELIDFAVVPFVANNIWDKPEVAYVGMLPQSSTHLLYGEPSVATFALTPFELHCQAAYRELLQLPEAFPDIWSGSFDTEIDKKASVRLDEVLGGSRQGRSVEEIFFNEFTLSEAILRLDFLDEKIELLPSRFKTKFINLSKGEQSHD